MRTLSRRSLLRGVGAAAVGTLAGCSNPLADSGSTPAFVRWAPDPGEIETGSRPYSTVGFGMSELAAVDTPWTNQAVDSFAMDGLFGDALDVEEVEHVQSVDTTVALEGGLDGTAVLESLRGEGGQDAEPVGEYEVVQAGFGGYAAAREDRVVVSQSRTAIEPIVRTREGAADRLPAASDPGSRLLAMLPTTTVTGARVHDPGEVGFSGSLAEGIAVDVGDEETTATGVVVFESGAADPDAVTEWAATAEPIDAADVETSTEDDVVAATATVQTSGLAGLWRNFPSPNEPVSERTAPQVQFGFDYEPIEQGRGRLTITHEGGDMVAADQLFLRGTGFADLADVDQTSPGAWQGSAVDDGQVGAGSSVTVGVAADYEVRVVWESSDGATSATLAIDEGPDA